MRCFCAFSGPFSRGCFTLSLFASQKFAKVQKARGEEKEAIQEVPRLLLKVGP